MTAKGRRAALWTFAGLIALVAAVGAYLVTVGPVWPIAIAQPIGFANQIAETTVLLGYDCTSGPSQVETLEETDRVTVRIRARSHSGDCGSGFELELEFPLGDRSLIDGTTGERIEVQNRFVPEHS